MNNWYQVINAEAIDSPALLLYPERILQNIRILKELIPDIDKIRPHAKTHKVQEVAEMMLAEGIVQFKSATIAEAEMLAAAGATDIFLAYQAAAPKALRLAALAAAYPAVRFSCLIDNMQTAALLNTIFDSTPCAVYIDLNIGMNRTGISPHLAADLYTQCQDLANLHIVGLHAYDGHLTDPDIHKRTTHAELVLKQVNAVKETIEKNGGSSLNIVMGGSPNFMAYAQQPDVQVSPGTFVFWDEGYRQLLPELEFLNAALLLCRVISIIDQQTLCLDLGHKSVAAENPLIRRVKFINAPDAITISQSEEHLVVKVPDTGVYQVGEPWYGVPYHVCPSVSLYETAHVIENNRYVRDWEVIARRRKITY